MVFCNPAPVRVHGYHTTQEEHTLGDFLQRVWKRFSLWELTGTHTKTYYPDVHNSAIYYTRQTQSNPITLGGWLDKAGYVLPFKML